MAKIIGIVNTSFTAKDGTEINGTNLYLTELIDKKKGQGESAEKIFLSANRVKDIPFKLEVGMDVEVLYNRFGKVKELRLIDPDVDFGEIE